MTDGHSKLDFSKLPQYSLVTENAATIPSSTKPHAKVCFDQKIQAGKLKVMKKPFCKFCYNRRRPASEFKSHFTKTGPEFGSKIVCPLLLAQQCARCGEIGHTPKECKSEHFLCSDPNRKRDLHYSEFYCGLLERPISWQHPIPPALQSKHKEWEEQNVKTSRIWITMSGDHSCYTDDFAICYGGPNWIPFIQKPKTEYEQAVEMHYRWLRCNIEKIKK
jgi:hypothetical protein